MVRERQGEKVGENCMAEQCLQSDTQAVEKKVWGTYHEPPWNKTEGLEQRTLPLKQVQVDDQSTPPSSYRSFIAYGGYDEPYAPALKTWKA